MGKGLGEGVGKGWKIGGRWCKVGGREWREEGRDGYIYIFVKGEKEPKVCMFGCLCSLLDIESNPSGAELNRIE